MLKHSILFLAFLLVSATLFTSCDDDDDDYLGNWVQIVPFNGIARSFPVTFTINNTVYVGTGYDVENKKYLSDFYKFDAANETWEKIADFPGIARNKGVAFASDSYGYVGLGYDGDNALSDFWKYDPDADSWTQVTDFPGGDGAGRYEAIAFGIDNMGYVGTGYDTEVYYNDFYIYDTENDTWTEGPSVKGTSKRRGAMCFTYQGKGYVVGGKGSASYLENLCVYDPEENSWTDLRKITNSTDYSFDDDYDYIYRIYGAAFVYKSYAYVTTGSGGSPKTTWRYDFAHDLWEQKNNFESNGSRTGAIAFTCSYTDGDETVENAYVGFGTSGSVSYDDLWTWYPEDEYESND